MLIETSRARRWTVWAVVAAALGALVLGGVGDLDWNWSLFPLIVAPGLLLGLIIALTLHFMNRDVLPLREDARAGWGPNMSRISYSGAAGLIFTLGSMAIFCVGGPPVRWFLALSLPLGIVVGTVLHFAHHD